VESDARDDDFDDDSTGKMFQFVAKTGKSATLVISDSPTSGGKNGGATEDEGDDKIEWPKFRQKNYSVSRC